MHIVACKYVYCVCEGEYQATLSQKAVSGKITSQEPPLNFRQNLIGFELANPKQISLREAIIID